MKIHQEIIILSCDVAKYFVDNHILIELPCIYSHRKVCHFSKLHIFCSLRAIRNCEWLWRVLTNHPSHECLHLGFVSFHSNSWKWLLSEHSCCLLLGVLHILCLSR